MKAALFDRRTVVWFKNTLIGREEHLMPLMEASLSMRVLPYSGRPQLRVRITNTSDVDYRFRNKSQYDFVRNADLIDIPQHETVTLTVKTGEMVEEIELVFEVLNALVAPKKTATMTFKAKVGRAEEE